MKGLAAYRRLLEREAKLGAQIKDARAKLAIDCSHPLGFVVPYTRTRGNGYGSSVIYRYNRCAICAKLQPVWGEGMSTQPWIEESQLRRDDD